MLSKKRKILWDLKVKPQQTLYQLSNPHHRHHQQQQIEKKERQLAVRNIKKLEHGT
jgi:hypothetical protein